MTDCVRYLVLKALPDGRQPNTIVDLPAIVGQILLAAGAVRLADDMPLSAPVPTRRRYQRRDLTAEA